ncbi:MAG: serine/threonine protein kinase [Planctomycetes bacterium]|nr:serine/threonine protein kinase [Planctomycetota bacterium]
MAKKRIFGLDPKKLDKLLSLGTEDLDGSDVKDKKSPTMGEDTPAKKIDAQNPTASLCIFAEQPGSQIGRYKLLSILGEGGMGIVYLAQQDEPIKRRVALKVIKPGMDSKRIIARFEAERQVLALLDHPNIAHVHDAGTTESGRPYFVMEYVKGLPITEHCDYHKLTVKERLRLFQQVCLAVHHAHQKGIIHRDIKPSNILVSTQDDQVIPKIIDFGVAKAIAQPLIERTLVTEQGQLFGTPEYMSPEQADMVNEDIDTRSDIYSLGVMLYVLLTGVLPFDSDTLREGGIDHIRKIIRETEPVAPSTRLSSLDADTSIKLAKCFQSDAETLRRKLRGDLDWITFKAMEKDRTRRYEMAHALAEDIERHLCNELVLAGRPNTVYRCKKFVRRHRALVTGALAVLSVLLLGVAGVVVFAWREKRQADRYQVVAEFLTEDLLGAVSPERARSPEVTVYSLLSAASEALEDKFATDPLVEATIRLTLGETFRKLGHYEEAEPHLKWAYEIRREYLGNSDPSTITSMSQLGRLYDLQGRYEEAELLLVNALQLRRRVLGPEHADTLDSTVRLGSLYFDSAPLARYMKALELLTEALETGRRVLGDEHPTTVEAICYLAIPHAMMGRTAVLPLCIRGLEAAKQVLGPEHELTLRLMAGSAILHSWQCRHEDAESLATEALEISRRVLGEEHPVTIECMCALGVAYRCAFRYEEAQELLSKAVHLNTLIQGGEHPNTLSYTAHLAHALLAQGLFEEAEQLLVKAIEIGRHELGYDHMALIPSLHTLPYVYAMQGQFEKVKIWAENEIESLRKEGGENHHALAFIYNMLGQIQAVYPASDIRDGDEAVDNARRACELTNWTDANLIDTLAAAYAEAGDFDSAVKWQKKAIDMVAKEPFSIYGGGFQMRLRLYESDQPARIGWFGIHVDGVYMEDNHEKAESVFKELLAHSRRIFGERHPETQGCMFGLIYVYESWNKPEKADEWRVKLQQKEAVEE